MPIYEYACPKCRVVFNFLSKRINPDRVPTCPKCGNKNMAKQVTRFAMSRGLKEPAAKAEGEQGGPPMPDMDDPRMERAMMEWNVTWSTWTRITQSTWPHDAQDERPDAGWFRPKELDVAIKRLEAGEDPEKSRKIWATCSGI